MAGFPKGKKKLGEPAKRPRAGIPLDKTKVIALLQSHLGNISKVADLLGCCRQVIQRMVEADPEVKAARDQARERFVDDLESKAWLDSIERADPAMRIFLLKTIGRQRGYDQDFKETNEVLKDVVSFVMNKSKNPSDT